MSNESSPAKKKPLNLVRVCPRQTASTNLKLVFKASITHTDGQASLINDPLSLSAYCESHLFSVRPLVKHRIL